MAALFDLDGVVFDTEQQYTVYWQEVGRRYHPAITDFAQRIKGRTLVEIFQAYFDGQAEAQAEISRGLVDFESRMHYDYLPGVEAFLDELRRHGVPRAIVTSSNRAKMACVYRVRPELTARFDAILVPGGFGIRGLDGKIGALKYAREHKLPTLGICLGLQSMVIEYARNVLGLTEASSTEFDPETSVPVIATIEEQKQFVEGAGDLGGTMRLGLYEANLVPGSQVAKAYGATEVAERHRHRYEVNNEYREQLEEAGLRISGTSPDSSLVEYVELPAEAHPYYVATQAHPEYRSRPTRPHPLFSGLIKAALERRSA